MAKTAKYTRINPNGTSYHVPETESGGFRIESSSRMGFAIFAPFIDKLGMYEDLFGERQIETLNREQRDRLAAYIRTL